MRHGWTSLAAGRRPIDPGDHTSRHERLRFAA
jgi:hypothetical protein